MIAPIMSEPLSLLADRAVRLLAITRRLSEENRELRAQLDQARSDQARLEARVNEARARGLPVAQVQALVLRHTDNPWLGLLGEPRVNVLALNLALDSLSNK